MLFCACLGIILPTAFAVAHEASSKSEDPHHLRRGIHDQDVLNDSRGTAFVLLCMYPAYLFFKLWPSPGLDPQINSSRRAHGRRSGGRACSSCCYMPAVARADSGCRAQRARARLCCRNEAKSLGVCAGFRLAVGALFRFRL